jgi:hypothetical protein
MFFWKSISQNWFWFSLLELFVLMVSKKYTTFSPDPDRVMGQRDGMLRK